MPSEYLKKLFCATKKILKIIAFLLFLPWMFVYLWIVRKNFEPECVAVRE